MTACEPDPRLFYTERVPAQFNRTLEAQRRQEALQRDLRAVERFATCLRQAR